MYECGKTPLTHELSYMGLFNYSHLNLFHVNVICKKVILRSPKDFFSLFSTPTVNGPIY